MEREWGGMGKLGSVLEETSSSTSNYITKKILYVHSSEYIEIRACSVVAFIVLSQAQTIAAYLSQHCCRVYHVNHAQTSV